MIAGCVYVCTYIDPDGDGQQHANVPFTPAGERQVCYVQVALLPISSLFLLYFLYISYTIVKPAENRGSRRPSVPLFIILIDPD